MDLERTGSAFHDLVIVGLVLLATPASAGVEPPSQVLPEAPCATEACHATLTSGQRLVHQPVEEGRCRECHVQKGAAHAFEKIDSVQLCRRCHDPLARPAGTGHEGKWVLHAPAEEDCLSCHQAHASNGPVLLNQPDRRTLCLDCHDEMEEKLGSHPHPATIVGKSCNGCHAAHAAPREKLLIADPGADLCARCHPTLVEAVRREGAVVHDPAGEDCGNCHEVHGGSRDRLLKGAFPSTFYNTFSEATFALCFDCHDEALGSDAAYPDTAFRDGDRNLHYVHVNQSYRGRTCVACHTVHAGSRPALIRQEARFGGWSMPIDFVLTQDGGACTTGCHTTRTYDRKKPKQGGG